MCLRRQKLVNQGRNSFAHCLQCGAIRRPEKSKFEIWESSATPHRNPVVAMSFQIQTLGYSPHHTAVPSMTAPRYRCVRLGVKFLSVRLTALNQEEHTPVTARRHQHGIGVFLRGGRGVTSCSKAAAALFYRFTKLAG